MSTAAIIEKFLQDEILMSGTPIDHQASLISAGLIDSLSLLRLIAFVENRFGIRVADEDVVPETFETIRLIADYIEHRK